MSAFEGKTEITNLICAKQHRRLTIRNQWVRVAARIVGIIVYSDWVPFSYFARREDLRCAPSPNRRHRRVANIAVANYGLSGLKLPPADLI
jgi:hypothetical protein